MHALHQKLELLADAAKYDASCASDGARARAPAGPPGVVHAAGADGRRLALLKLLLSNHCVYDCGYCVNRRSSDVPRARLTPEEVVRLTLAYARRGEIDGLFLSSGVDGGPDATMERLVEVARSLREDHGYRGYVHLKAVPGASAELLTRAGRHADRLSANVELPTEADLARLAPDKRHAATGETLARIRDGVEAARSGGEGAPAFAPAGQTTQLIVGATPTPDAAVLACAEALYRRFGLRRIYYSAYRPIPGADARLPAVGPPLAREHRLYQADWLMRAYGFRVDELTPPGAPHLSLDLDPKLAWALRRRERFPVDVNRAPRELLLRVPGLGLRTVGRLLRIRRWHRVTLADLARLRVPLARVRPFVVTHDWRPTLLLDEARLADRLRPVTQLSLFEAAASARTGEL